MATIERLNIIEDNKVDKSKIVFKVSDGLDKLKYKIIEDENGKFKKCLFLDDVPILMYYDNIHKKGSIMANIAEGRECVDEDIIESFSSLNSVSSIEDGFVKLKHILSFLHNGYYVLSDIEAIPTDDSSNVFWCLDGREKEFYIQEEFCKEDFGYISGCEKFLISTQGLSSYDQKKVDYYRKKIVNKEKFYALSMSVFGMHSILLDGHHKAVASFLEGKNIKCLNISKYNVYSKNDAFNKSYNLRENFNNEINIKDNKENVQDIFEIVFSGEKHEKLKLQNKSDVYRVSEGIMKK